MLTSLLISCNQKNDHSKNSTNESSSETPLDSDYKIIELSEPAIISHYIDSIGFEQILEKYGEDAQTIFDDLMWYDYQMNLLADSLKIPVIDIHDRKIAIKYNDKSFTHLQDTAVGAQSHFYYDGKTIKEYDLIEITQVISK